MFMENIGSISVSDKGPILLFRASFHITSYDRGVYMDREIHMCIIRSHHDLRQELFSQGKHLKIMQNLPPTQDSLTQHAIRSIYQASIWLMSLQSQQNVPSYSPNHLLMVLSSLCWHLENI